MADKTVDETMAELAQYLTANSESALPLAQKLHDLVVAEKADWQLALGALAMTVKGVAKNLPDADDNRTAVRCIATGMLAANVDLGSEPALVS